MRTEAADQKIDGMKKKRKERWKWASSLGQRHLRNYMTSQWIYMCLCVRVLSVWTDAQTHLWDSVSDQSECWCETDSWAMSYQLVLQPPSIRPSSAPFPPHWQHPKQPALITTHPSIRTLLSPGQVSSPGEIGQAWSQRMDEDRVRYQWSLKGRKLVWGFGVEGMCQTLCEECHYGRNQHVRTTSHINNISFLSVYKPEI